MKLWKRLTAGMLSAALLLGAAGTTNLQDALDWQLAAAYTDSSTYLLTEDGFYYAIIDGEATVYGYGGEETEITIPAEIKGRPVSEIAAYTNADGSWEYHGGMAYEWNLWGK